MVQAGTIGTGLPPKTIVPFVMAAACPNKDGAQIDIEVVDQGSPFAARFNMNGYKILVRV